MKIKGPHHPHLNRHTSVNPIKSTPLTSLKRLLFAISVLLTAPEAQAQMPDASGVLHVRKGAAGNGSSWSNALGELADALRFAKHNNALPGPLAVTQIWVMAGTYKPLYSPADNNFGNPGGRDNAFLLVPDVKIYGGFPATGNPGMNDRDPAANVSILSGDFNDDDQVTGSGDNLAIAGNAENAFHVLLAVGNTGSAELDGFTVKGGYGDDVNNLMVNGENVAKNRGGGMHCVDASPILTHLIFEHNAATLNGGAMYNYASSPAVSNTSFIRNKANNNGGAMFNLSGSSPGITNSTFSYNRAVYDGAALFTSVSSPVIGNSHFIFNSAGSGGAALYNNNASPAVSNTVFSGNTANNGGAVYNNNNSAPSFRNSTFTGNKANNTGAVMHNTLSSPSIINSLIADNTANSGAGTAIYHASGDDALVLNSTLYGNKNNMPGLITPSGLYILGGSINVYNSILWRNSSGIQYAGPGRVNPEYSLIETNSTTTNGNIDARGITTAQIFADAPAGDFTLKTGSPAIGKGSNALYGNTLATDADLGGDPRLMYAVIDVGPYEDRPFPAPVADVSDGNQAGENVTVNILGNDKLADGSPATTTNSTVALTTVGLPEGSTLAGNTVTVPDQGTWTYSPGTGNLTFSAEAGFTSDPTPLTYTLTDHVTGRSKDAAVNVVYNPMPVKLVRFTARPSEGVILLDWVTSEEVNFERFEILRSKNGRNFKDIGAVTGTGTASTYGFTDTGAENGNNYYRLRMTDRDGSYEYSGIVRGVVSGKKPAITVYPNPAADFVTVTGLKGNELISVINTLGIELIKVKANSQQYQVHLGGLPAGVYTICILHPSGASADTRNVVKE
ncbi:hypothetical protein GCM10023091_19450 [Ravibacter arvi]|uniref:Secretion system C-terminal sorting domain-containing protein n=1 Tax=Ravibacter arvi TaxID=2051041 RepID=A0ABP8LWB6_9BACT